MMRFNMKAHYVYIILCTLFLIYSFTIYIQPSYKKNEFIHFKKAAEGRLVWQKYNCQSCHQFYGLGGYLGPDLTNMMSRKDAVNIVKGMIVNGTKIMPAYQISDSEFQALVEFLHSTNASGIADPRIFKVHSTGIIERK